MLFNYNIILLGFPNLFKCIIIICFEAKAILSVKIITVSYEF